MFFKIDAVLIDITQYNVRQIELLSTVTRKNLITFFVTIAMGISLSFIVILPLILTSDGYFFLAGECFVTGVFSFLINRQLKKIASKKQKPGILPFEISTRQFQRGLWLCLLTMLLVFATLTNIPELYTTKDISGLFNLILIISMCCTEYLLCTTSIPPEEKARKLREKETKNFISP